MAWLESHWGRLAIILMLSIWAIQLYLIGAQWSDMKSGTNETDGWHVEPGKGLFDPNNNPVAKSLGADLGSGAGYSEGWCTDCGNDAGKKPCDPRCYGNIQAGTISVPAGEAVPIGDNVSTWQECSDLCQKKYNNAMKAAPSGIGKKTVPIQDACQAWEYRPAAPGIQPTCYTYSLSAYPPIPFAGVLTEHVSGWAVNVYTERAVMRQLASTLLIIVPMALFFVAYNNYYYPTSLRLSPAAIAIPIALGVAVMGFLMFVGFKDTNPSMEFSCNGALGQACFADALVGGQRSGGCYNKCCGRSISCRIKSGVWSTCTWPNVMCKDGSCVSSADLCSKYGGLMEDCDTGVKGGEPQTGYDYQGCDAHQFATINNITGTDFPQKPNDGQYPGEPNCNPPAVAKEEIGTKCLPPGRSDNYVDPETGTWKYPTFGMNDSVRVILDQPSSSGTTQTLGCGMATDPATNTEKLFLQEVPIPLQCVVPSGKSSAS